MRRILIGAAAIIFGATTKPTISQAQCTANGAPANCGLPGSVSMTAGRVVRLQMNAGSTSLTAPTPADFDAPARTNKPAADLMWSTAANGSFAALTTGDANLVNGAATANNATTLYFQTLYHWTLDTPGSYSLSIVLTLTSP